MGVSGYDAPSTSSTHVNAAAAFGKPSVGTARSRRVGSRCRGARVERATGVRVRTAFELRDGERQFDQFPRLVNQRARLRARFARTLLGRGDGRIEIGKPSIGRWQLAHDDLLLTSRRSSAYQQEWAAGAPTSASGADGDTTCA
jgi:hypothetical protein